ncbi:MAG TPA: YncE family protein [Spirochaetota bacterium]|nr:YncE family protein [Spirochaetota bacterium]
MLKKLFSLLIILSTISCSYKYRISVIQEDCEIYLNDIKIKNSEITTIKNRKPQLKITKRGYKDYQTTITSYFPFITKNINIDLQKERYNVKINLIDGISNLIINEKDYGKTPLEIELESGIYNGILKRNDYPDENIRIECFSDMNLTFRHKKTKTPLYEMGIFKCGDQPKQVIFSYDNKKILIPLLNEKGFELFDSYNRTSDNLFFHPPDKTNDTGYAEGLFIKEKGTFFVSQMTTGSIYEYDYNDFSFKRTVKTGGLYPKIIVYSKKQNVLAVSNWVSGNISIIDYESGNVLKKIKTAVAPRGLVFSNDEEYLYAADYEGGTISKIETSKWSIIKTITIQNGCMRHILITKDDKYLYVSDMFNFNVLKIKTDDLSIENKYKVFYNPNTIDLSKNEKYLFVSCRGPNSSEGYLSRSPVDGKIEVIDLINNKIIYSFDGGNQTTGLDIDDTGRYLAFSNFRDANIEIYYLPDEYTK